MKMYKVFSVFDSKAEAFLQPMFLPTKGIAIRVIVDSLNKEEHPFAKHPTDFTLMEIGEWDDTKGVLVNYEVNTSVGNLVEFKEGE